MAKKDAAKPVEEPKPEEERTRGRLRRAVAKAAPKIAEQLGGPLAGAAVEALARAIFGKEAVPEDALAEAVENASADQIIALKRAENDFRIALRQAAVEESRIDASDRASARDRQTKMDDLDPWRAHHRRVLSDAWRHGRAPIAGGRRDRVRDHARRTGDDDSGGRQLFLWLVGGLAREDKASVATGKGCRMRVARRLAGLSDVLTSPLSRQERESEEGRS